MRVGLDVDGTLLDMWAAFRLWVERKYGLDVEPEAHHYYDFGYGWGLPKEDLAEMWDFVWDTPLHPYPGVHQFLSKLEVDGHEVHLISYRPEVAAREAAVRDFPQLSYSHHHLLASTPKSEVVNKHAIDVVLDDDPRNCVDVAEHSSAKALLLDRPWNANAKPILRSYVRVFNYSEAYEEIACLAERSQET
jgi:uncharacterized HAD superfamily protein